MTRALRLHLVVRGANLGGRRRKSGHPVTPGEGQHRARVRQHEADARPDVAAPVDEHLTTVTLPPEELAAERAAIGGAGGGGPGLPEESFDRRLIRWGARSGGSGHAAVSDARESGCVRRVLQLASGRPPAAPWG